MNAKPEREYWERPGISDSIFDALRSAGIDLNDLSVHTLAPLDQFHGGGINATLQLAELAQIKPGTRVLDVGGGFGGPARTLASEYQCMVTSVDLSQSYIDSATALTAQCGLGDRVTHHVADALSLPFDANSFEMVWTQNSGMNIRDKERLYCEFSRVLCPGGKLVFQEPMAGPVQPILYPVMWADDPGISFLQSPDEMKDVITSSGFKLKQWLDVTHALHPSTSEQSLGQSIQALVMGERLDAITKTAAKNRQEGRILMTHAVFEKVR